MARQSEPGVPILVTRPKAEGEAFASALTARFGDRVRPVVTPLLVPRFLKPELPAREYTAVIFTSAQAVEAARLLGISLPELAWCVGRKTAAVARSSGFSARSADGDAYALAEAILAEPPNGRILYLRGVDTRGNLPDLLKNSGITIDVAIVYEQEAHPLSSAALNLLRSGSPLIAPLFSPRTAELFLAGLPSDRKAPLHLAVMSPAVAGVVSRLADTTVAVARQPDAPGMLDAVESLLVGLAPP